VALPLAVIAGLGVFAVSGGFDRPATGPVTVETPPAGATADADCATVLGKLPTQLGDRQARPVSDAPQRVVAWGDPPVVLRCGVAAPAVAQDAQLVTVDGVTWTSLERADVVVWTTTGRPVAVELRVPSGDQAQALLVSVAPALRG
jgi:hypothetical protein